jgi:phage terminase small subunit
MSMDQADVEELRDQFQEQLTHLTDKQQLFALNYVGCGCNATEAAKRAGYRNPHVIGCRLKKVKGIDEIIQSILADKAMSIAEWVALVSADAKGEIGRYIGEDGELDIATMREDGKTYLIDQIVPTKYGTSYKGPTRQKAQDMLGKALGIYQVQHIVSGEVRIAHSLDERLDQIADLFRDAGESTSEPKQD